LIICNGIPNVNIALWHCRGTYRDNFKCSNKYYRRRRVWVLLYF